jgi:3-keto-L-gulonate-6-phosphate decarboxylase/nucleoside phosphorylase
MFKLDPAATERCNAVVVVPKMDERVGLEQSWGVNLEQAHGRVGSKKYWGLRGGGLSLVVVFLNDQGTGAARGITEQVVSEFNPDLLFLLGTAAGREGKTGIADVVVSTFVADLTEQRAGAEGITFRAREHRPSELLEDATEFLAKKFDAAGFASGIESRAGALPTGPRAFYAKRDHPPRVEPDAIASGSTLYVGDLLKRVWDHDDRYRAVDMESGGFASALAYPESQWLVVRGISDFGTKESKREEFRPLAAGAAADFLAAFLRDGLDEAQPRTLRRRSKRRFTPDQEISLYKALRRYWAPADLADRARVDAESDRALGSGNWALEREARRVRAIGDRPSLPLTLEDHIGSDRRLQVALDLPSLERAVPLARDTVAAGADFVEVGDPLIRQHGFAAITAVHEALPEVPVIAELSTSDWSASQVEMAAAAGADAVLLLGCWRDASVIEAATAAERFRIPLIIEVPDTLATEGWVRGLERAGVQGVAVIGNLDSRSEGVASLDRARQLRRMTNLPIAVSGGLTEDDFPALDQVPWDVLIVGRAIVGSDTPAAATRTLARRTKAKGR